MRRIRIVFLLLALLLLVPLALVVDQAFRSVAAERAMRHDVLANRIVDEMERELTTWLRREEDRPFAQYRYFFVPEGSPTQLVNLTRSPVSRPPQEPFLVCYFQIDPDGTISSPLWPDNEQLAVATGWSPSPEIRQFVDLVGEAVADFWSSEGGAAPADRRAADVAGTTLALERPGRKSSKKSSKQRQDELLPVEQEPATSYLETLNRGASSRRGRATKIEPSQAANVYNFLQREANVLHSAVESQADAVTAQSRQAGAELLATTPEIEQGIAEVLETDLSSTIEVRLQPMVGRLATADHLVLYRTVSIGEEIYRQGLILDVRVLVDWVSERLFSNQLASRARVSFGGSAPDRAGRDLLEAVTAAGGRSVYSYRRWFAEPFDSVAVDIALEPLPETGGSLNLTSLSLLLACASTFGLFALYRMVAVVVVYAERRNNFVSAVTHELKTPLTAIRMYGEMLRDGMVAEEGKRQQYYEIITAETERLTRLVQNVLELSQLEQKKRTMRIVAGDVVPVVEEVLDVLRPHAEKQGFALRLQVEQQLPEVRYDRDALVQVLFNLVDNALKYSRKASDKEIVLRCRPDGQGVRVSVADHGPGVARAHLKKIFEPFYRAEDELTRRSKGTGIGLALVRGLVERMGGSVAGHNSSGGGFEVEVFLAAAS